MKKILLFITAIFICGAAIAQTIRWHIGDTVYQTTTCNAGESITPPTAPEKFGYTFQEWEARYTQIEYLESTGTQYIDTGVKPKDTLTFITKVQPLTNDFTFFGARFSEVHGMLATFSEAAGFILDYGSGMGYNRISTTWQRGVVYNVAFGNRYIKNLDTGKFFISEHSVNYEEVNLYIYLFGLNINGTYTPTERSGRCYYFQIYDNDILVRDMIPVLDPDGVPCMYDKVEGKFYYNAGTGDFIAGPVIEE